VTVAGLLDIDWWVRVNGWLPLTGSLNPASVAYKIVDIPQIHFFGYKDRVITPVMSQRFAELAPFKNLKRTGLDLDHYSGWTDRWSVLLSELVMPLRKEASAP
jgi:hypothetical protein